MNTAGVHTAEFSISGVTDSKDFFVVINISLFKYILTRRFLNLMEVRLLIMKKKKIIIPALILLLLAILGNLSKKIKEKDQGQTEHIAAIPVFQDEIKSCRVYSFKELTKEEQLIIPEFSNYHVRNWNEGVRFNKDTSFYVKAVVDNKKLRFQNRNYRFNFYRNGIEILKTEKFTGFKILNNATTEYWDTLLIGPLPQKPDKFEIKIHEKTFAKSIF